ncbi:unnamed protein product [Symbiodinium sp. KB8]|nr:unnamed protein product [Symbiodinium sp. KB8]
MDALSRRLDEVERRLALFESAPEAPKFLPRLDPAAADKAPLKEVGFLTEARDAASGDWLVEPRSVMKYLRHLQGEVSALRRALPLGDQLQDMWEVVSSMQCSVDVMKSKTESMEHQVKDITGHMDSTRLSLLDKQMRMENAMGYSLGTEIPEIRADLKGLQIDLRAKQESWLKEATGKLQAMQSMPAWFARLEGDIQDRCTTTEADLKQKLSKMEGRWNEKCSCFTVEVSRLVDSKLDGKLDVSLWDELKVDIEAAVMTLREMLRTQRVSMEGELKALRSESDVRALEASTRKHGQGNAGMRDCMKERG